MIAPRRFWADVSVIPEAGGYGLRLDDRPLRTPAQAMLTVPTRALAEALAAEWRAIEGEVRPEALPFTKAANVAIDRIARDPAPVVDAIAAYGETDLLCYRAAAPEGLRQRQRDGWDPMLGWAAQALGAPLAVGVGIVHVPQPPRSIAALRAATAALDPFALTALHELVALSGSLVLGLAVAHGATSAPEAWRLSRIDEDWQHEQWGSDGEAVEAAERRRIDFLRAGALLKMLAESAGIAYES